MNYSESLNLFGFTGTFTEENLRKKYLELSKKYHPDMGGSDEMMKKVNAAYVALKDKSTNYDLTYFNSLKEKLQKFVSKKVYESGSAEYECVNKINELVNSFAYISNKVILNSAYNNILAKINSVLSEYRKTVLNNIPEKFLKKYDNNIVDCIDEFIKKVNVIKKDYENIENTLNNIIQTLDITMNENTLEKILNMKKVILNDIIDDKISLQDGANRLRCEIMTMVMQKEALDKELDETYNAILVNFNARMKELKFTDNEQIQTSLDVLKDALAKLQLVKENKLNKEKYMRLDDFLDNAVFFNKYYSNGILAIYMCYGTVIYITNNGIGTIKVGRASDLGLMDESSYYPYMYGLQYKERYNLKKGIYDDFKEYLDPKYRQIIDCNVQKEKFRFSRVRGI